MNIEISGAERGTTRITTIMTNVGMMSFSVRETSRRGFISISRSAFVVKSFIMGGCTNATVAT